MFRFSCKVTQTKLLITLLAELNCTLILMHDWNIEAVLMQQHLPGKVSLFIAVQHLNAAAHRTEAHRVQMFCVERMICSVPQTCFPAHASSSFHQFISVKLKNLPHFNATTKTVSKVTFKNWTQPTRCPHFLATKWLHSAGLFNTHLFF